jgi:hypothetical protein
MRRTLKESRLKRKWSQAELGHHVESTVTAWKTLEQKQLLPHDIRKIIDVQIQTTATNIQRLWQ